MENLGHKQGPNIEFHLHGALSLLLPNGNLENVLTRPVAYRASVKDAVEAQGIPHTEVELLLRDGVPIGWSVLLTSPSRLDLYDWDLPDWLHHSFRLQPEMTLPPRFALDVHLGRLAGYLRLLGFDATYSASDPGDAALVAQSLKEERILLTCDRGLLMRSAVQLGCLLRSRSPRQQVVELLDRYGLRDQSSPFSRCMACNGELGPTDVETISRLSPPLVRLRYGLDQSRYKSCPDCGRLFWWGTHSDRMVKLLKAWGIPWKDTPPPA